MSDADGVTPAIRRRLGLLVSLSLVLYLMLSGCVSPMAIFSKDGDAITPVAQLGGIETVSQCPSFASYQAQADATLQRLCLTCHGPSGQGAATFQFNSGDSTSDDLAAANFFIIRDKAAPIGGVTSASDPDGTSLLLTKINGTVSHPYTLDIAGDDYFVIRNWVAEELTQMCSIDPLTGTVTIVPGT